MTTFGLARKKLLKMAETKQSRKKQRDISYRDRLEPGDKRLMFHSK